MDDWVRAALTHYRSDKDNKAGYAHEIAWITHGITHGQDHRDAEVVAAEAAAMHLLVTKWQPTDTRTWIQRITGDRSQERLWGWRKQTAAEACRVAIRAVVYADRLPATTVLAALRPFGNRVEAAAGLVTS